MEPRVGPKVEYYTNSLVAVLEFCVLNKSILQIFDRHTCKVNMDRLYAHKVVCKYT